MNENYDAVVIGGGVGGLAAAAYVAQAGARTVLIEARKDLGGTCAPLGLADGFRAPGFTHALFALDPQVMKDLKLARAGLEFAVRDMALVGIGEGRRPLVIDREMQASARAIASFSVADAQAFPHFCDRLFDLAHAMRRFWWEESAGTVEQTLKRRSDRHELSALAVTGASALLGGWFESEALKAMLAFDAAASGLSVIEPGSALVLLWHAAQDMCGLQGARAIPRGGIDQLARALASVARTAGAELRPATRVARIMMDRNSVSGVELDTGERLTARVVLSSLSRRTTLLQLAPTAAAGLAATAHLGHTRAQTGEARLILGLKAMPSFGAALSSAGRFIFADRLETYTAAQALARAGKLPHELALEAVVPTASDSTLAPSGQHILSVRALPLPRAPAEGWPALRAPLAETILSVLERHAPGLRSNIVAQTLVTPDESLSDPCSVGRLLAPAARRIGSQIEGLFFCGRDAEPVAAISARAARFAAALALLHIAHEAAS